MKKINLPITCFISLTFFFGLFFYRNSKIKNFDDLTVKAQEPSGNFVILNITEQNVTDRGGLSFSKTRLCRYSC